MFHKCSKFTRLNSTVGRGGSVMADESSYLSSHCWLGDSLDFILEKCNSPESERNLMFPRRHFDPTLLPISPDLISIF